MLLVASILVLFLLSSFAIRSNLNTQMPVANQNPTDRVSRRNRRLVTSKKRISINDIPGHFELVETTHTGEITSEGDRPDLPESASRNDASISDPTVAKRTVVEIFKANPFDAFQYQTCSAS